MTRDEIRTRISDLLADLLDNDGLVLTDSTTAAEVQGWDSLVQLRLLVAVESEWGVGFTVSEINPANVGDLVDLVQSKSGG